VPAGKHVAAFSQGIIILIVKILPSQLAISLPGSALIGQEEIF
jgi:hypothetical protein